jgi:murein DD-endopeptidase MepM/ murein hydrolase activator NlpD
VFVVVAAVGCARSDEVVPPADPPADVAAAPVPLQFATPFRGEARLVNYFDHDVPLQFHDHNGVQLTTWGEATIGIDGHSGYDWDLPEGTDLLGVADGRVVGLGVEAPFFCPLLERVVDGQQFVRVRHNAPDGSRFDVVYKHLSAILVAWDDVVRPGDVIGRSGSTGCTTGAHLHLEVWRMTDTPLGAPVAVDPYGWSGPGDDPWAIHPSGAESVWLWAEGAAPPLFREIRREPNPGPNERAPVAITALRWMGPDDAAAPNNEFVELAVDARFADAGAVDLTGWTLLNERGDRYDFPDGFVLRAGHRVRVYTGPGVDGPEALYWGRGAGAWSTQGDKARLLSADGAVVYQLW